MNVELQDASPMMEFIQHCFAPVNLPYTALLGAVFCYWLLFVIGAVGLESFDLDLDLDLDLDADADLDVDTSGDLSGGSVASTTWVGLLRFFNVGDVPMMVLISVMSFSMWTVSMIVNYYFNSTLSVLFALILFVPNLLLSMFVTKIVTTPVRKVFRHANAGIEAPLQLVGKTCMVTTSEVTPSFGQGEIARDGAPITLNVRCREGERLVRGDEALIMEHNKARDTYTVIRFDLEGK